MVGIIESMEPANPDAVEPTTAPQVPKMENAPVVQKRSFWSRINFLRGISNLLKRNKGASQENVEVNTQMPGPSPSLPPEQYVHPPTPQELWPASRGETPASQLPPERSMSTEDLTAQVAKLAQADETTQSGIAEGPQVATQPPVESPDKKAA